MRISHTVAYYLFTHEVLLPCRSVMTGEHDPVRQAFPWRGSVRTAWAEWVAPPAARLSPSAMMEDVHTLQ
ncbi:hypothetical protein E2C01_098745 [Portunus trituberculatus]|uniref:Uncharacterized protein n=1 Tax=Portunus trituberculatus TaxID=210409 RepID=A0A5B7JYJ9_PORTR|nr:hypothetical protein [Portunus trituberculatus]